MAILFSRTRSYFELEQHPCLEIDGAKSHVDNFFYEGEGAALIERPKAGMNKCLRIGTYTG